MYIYTYIHIYIYIYVICIYFNMHIHMHICMKKKGPDKPETISLVPKKVGESDREHGTAQFRDLEIGAPLLELVMQ